MPRGGFRGRRTPSSPGSLTPLERKPIGENGSGPNSGSQTTVLALHRVLAEHRPPRNGSSWPSTGSAIGSALSCFSFAPASRSNARTQLSALSWPSGNVAAGRRESLPGSNASDSPAHAGSSSGSRSNAGDDPKTKKPRWGTVHITASRSAVCKCHWLRLPRTQNHAPSRQRLPSARHQRNTSDRNHTPSHRSPACAT